MEGAGSLAIGIDIGGTKTAVGLVDGPTGVVLERREIETEASRGADSLHNRLGPVVAEISGEHGTLDVGIAVPELVSPTQEIVTDVVIPGLAGDLAMRWRDLHVTAVESDVRAAAVAEARFGHGDAFDPFAFVSVGTGVSCCFVMGGRPWSGVHGAAILLGSGVVVERGIEPSPSPLESVAGGPGLLARFRSLGGRAATAQEVVAMSSDDASAREAVAAAGAALGAGIAEMVNLLDPAAVVVGGGLGAAGGSYWESAVAEARERIWADVARDVPLLRSRIGPDAGLIGAALVA